MIDIMSKYQISRTNQVLESGQKNSFSIIFASMMLIMHTWLTMPDSENGKW